MPEDYRKALAAYIAREARPIDKLSHQPRLYSLACRIAAGQPYDDDVLYAAAWLHDLGVFLGHRPEDPEALARWDNVAYAVERVPDILRKLHFPASKTPAVVEAIRTHLPTSSPVTPEAIALRDADILEQLGAVGILRTVSKIGRDTRFHVFPDALAALRRNLAALPGQIRTETARALAVSRIHLMQTFLAAAECELSPNSED